MRMAEAGQSPQLGACSLCVLHVASTSMEVDACDGTYVAAAAKREPSHLFMGVVRRLPMAVDKMRAKIDPPR